MRRAENLLLDVCRDDPSSRPTYVGDEDLAAVLELAALYDVIPPVVTSLRRTQGSLPAGLRTWSHEQTVQLELLHAHSVIQDGLAAAELERAMSAFGDIPVLVIKGPALARLYWSNAARAHPSQAPRAGLRSYRDLDLCVHDPDYAAARDALLALGYRVMSGYDQELQRKLAKDLGFIREDEWGNPWSIELHWRLTERGGPRLDEKGVWDRARRISISGSWCLSPGPEDTLALLALNLRKHRFARLKTLCDVHQLITLEGATMDVELVHRLAHEGGFCMLLRRTLALGAELLGTQPVALPACERSVTAHARLLKALASREIALGEGLGVGGYDPIAGLLPFVSLDKASDIAKLVWERLSLSPELASYRAGERGMYRSRKQYIAALLLSTIGAGTRAVWRSVRHAPSRQGVLPPASELVSPLENDGSSAPQGRPGVAAGFRKETA